MVPLWQFCQKICIALKICITYLYEIDKLGLYFLKRREQRGTEPAASSAPLCSCSEGREVQVSFTILASLLYIKGRREKEYAYIIGSVAVGSILPGFSAHVNIC